MIFSQVKIKNSSKGSIIGKIFIAPYIHPACVRTLVSCRWRPMLKRIEGGIIESGKTFLKVRAGICSAFVHAIVIRWLRDCTCRSRSPSRTPATNDVRQILHLRASLINNRIAAYTSWPIGKRDETYVVENTVLIDVRTNLARTSRGSQSRGAVFETESRYKR